MRWKLLGGKANTDKPGRCATDEDIEIPLGFKNEIKKIEEWAVGREAAYFQLKPISTPPNKLVLLLDAAGASR